MSSTEPDIADRTLGETAGPLPLEDLAALRAAGIRMASQATRELRIFTHDLDAALYDDAQFLDALRRIGLGGAEGAVRILVYRSDLAVRRGHRLIELARQLTSRIRIRQVPKELQQPNESYLLADDRGYVLRRLADVYEGTADFKAPLEVRRLREQFDALWEMSEDDPELRRLYV